MRTKRQAQEEAERLLELIGQEGWQVKIWENMGWHCKATKGYLSIYTSIGDEYHAVLGTEKGCGGTPTYWSTESYHEDPMEAVRIQMRKALEFVTNCQGIVTDALRDIGWEPDDLFDVPDGDYYDDSGKGFSI